MYSDPSRDQQTVQRQNSRKRITYYTQYLGYVQGGKWLEIVVKYLVVLGIYFFRFSHDHNGWETLKEKKIFSKAMAEKNRWWRRRRHRRNSIHSNPALQSECALSRLQSSVKSVRRASHLSFDFVVFFKGDLELDDTKTSSANMAAYCGRSSPDDDVDKLRGKKTRNFPRQ